MRSGLIPSAAVSRIMSNESPPDPVASQQPGSTSAIPEERLIYRSSDLLKDRREIFIEHNRDLYRLRITSQGRLILTK